MPKFTFKEIKKGDTVKIFKGALKIRGVVTSADNFDCAKDREAGRTNWYLELTDVVIEKKGAVPEHRPYFYWKEGVDGGEVWLMETIELFLPVRSRA